MRLAPMMMFLAACGQSADDVVAPGDDAPVTAHKRVFVTSTTFSGDLMTPAGVSIEAPNPGVTGANALCQTAAMAGVLGGTWKAIVDQPGGGLDALADVGPWYRLDGSLVFNNRVQLKTTPSVPINLDEHGRMAVMSSCVWTGLQAGGTPLPGCYAQTFGIWTFGNSAQSGTVGDLSATDARWLYSGQTNCNGPCHLYCIEQ